METILLIFSTTILRPSFLKRIFISVYASFRKISSILFFSLPSLFSFSKPSTLTEREQEFPFRAGFIGIAFKR